MGASATEFVLGPALDNVIEPVPSAPKLLGRRSVSFRTPPTAPGGIARVALDPTDSQADTVPLNVYAFYVQPVANVPQGDARTPDWFFKSGAPNASVHQSRFNPDGTIDIPVPNVTPSLQPYFVQVVLEFPKAAS